MSASRLDAVCGELNEHQRSNKPPISVVGTSEGEYLVDLPDLVKGDPGHDQSTWLQFFDHLRSFKDSNGHMKTPVGYHVSIDYGGNNQINRNLRAWCDFQRKNLMPPITKAFGFAPKRIEMLNLIDFPWCPRDEAWEDNFIALQKYAQLHNDGNCNIHMDTIFENKKIGNWVSMQRACKDKLSAVRVARLEAVGFAWNAHEMKWEDNFVALQKYARIHKDGNCNIHRNTIFENKRIGRWVQTQRARKKIDKVSATRVVRLEAVGFKWYM